MNLNDLPDGASVVVDANIFVYHFTGVSIQCRDLLERSERKEIYAATGAHIIFEVLHRLSVRLYPTTLKQIRSSEAIRSAYGVMTNDSVTAAMMFNYGAINLASLDSDLSRIPGINLYQPTDVP